VGTFLAESKGDVFLLRAHGQGGGQAQHKTYKIFPGSPKQAGKKERGFRETPPKESPKATLQGKNFCPPVCPAEQDLRVEDGSRRRRDFLLARRRQASNQVPLFQISFFTLVNKIR